MDIWQAITGKGESLSEYQVPGPKPLETPKQRNLSRQVWCWRSLPRQILPGIYGRDPVCLMLDETYQRFPWTPCTVCTRSSGAGFSSLSHHLLTQNRKVPTESAGLWNPVPMTYMTRVSTTSTLPSLTNSRPASRYLHLPTLFLSFFHTPIHLCVHKPHRRIPKSKELGFDLPTSIPQVLGIWAWPMAPGLNLYKSLMQKSWKHIILAFKSINIS